MHTSARYKQFLEFYLYHNNWRLIHNLTLYSYEISMLLISLETAWDIKKVVPFVNQFSIVQNSLLLTYQKLQMCDISKLFVVNIIKILSCIYLALGSRNSVFSFYFVQWKIEPYCPQTFAYFNPKLGGENVKQRW